MSGKIVQLRKAKKYRNATSRSNGRQRNDAYRVGDIDRGGNGLASSRPQPHSARSPRLADRAGHLPPWSAGSQRLAICAGDDIDLRKRTIIVRRLKASTDSVHYLERDEVNGLKLLQRHQQANGTKGAYVFIDERGRRSAGWVLDA